MFGDRLVRRQMIATMQKGAVYPGKPGDILVQGDNL